mmetsp:Transcript_33181/g.53187  ORF Transcript_33181/g.53187 Transcript_33181/m.53187 type:complete len:336 (+) Transcript_33181:184-1191(+)
MPIAVLFARYLDEMVTAVAARIHVGHLCGIIVCMRHHTIAFVHAHRMMHRRRFASFALVAHRRSVASVDTVIAIQLLLILRLTLVQIAVGIRLIHRSICHFIGGRAVYQLVIDAHLVFHAVMFVAILLVPIFAVSVYRLHGIVTVPSPRFLRHVPGFGRFAVLLWLSVIRVRCRRHILHVVVVVFAIRLVVVVELWFHVHVISVTATVFMMATTMWSSSRLLFRPRAFIPLVLATILWRGGTFWRAIECRQRVVGASLDMNDVMRRLDGTRSVVRLPDIRMWRRDHVVAMVPSRLCDERRCAVIWRYGRCWRFVFADVHHRDVDRVRSTVRFVFF